MSRCFPFPPPGYDKKPIPDDGNVLKEERQKEKKHKKDKKNKEKREGKEKRDKERSEGKHKEKRDKKDKHKDKKDKHREKKEKKDRGKEKEKSSLSEASKVLRVAEGNRGEKLVLKEGKDNTNCLDENTCAVQFHGQNGEEPVQCNFIARGTEESKYVQELGKRIRDQEKVTSNQLERLPGAEKRRDDESERFGVSNHRNSGEEKGKSTNKEFDIRKVDGQGYREEARISGHSMAQNLVGTAKTEVSEIPAMVEKNGKRRMEEKEQTKDKREKRGDNHKDKGTEKKDQGKEKDRGKERKKEEKVKNKSEQKKSELGKLIDANRSNLTDATHKAASSPSEPSNKAKAEGNLKKRKDLEINGFHDDEIRPSKLQRPASHPVMENGRKFEASQTPGFFASDLPDVAASLKLDNKKHKKNGTVESQSLPFYKEKPSMPIVPDVILEVPKKHLHPDSKYLNQVLSVPKIEEWSDGVDNDWLSGSKECLSKKDKVDYVVDEEPKVWSNALYLESADVVALPYVVPY